MQNIMDLARTPYIGGMRKPQEFVVYFHKARGYAVVQSDKSNRPIDLSTGQGFLNIKGGYFPHLALAAPFTFPSEFVAAVKDACEKGQAATLTD